MSNETFKSTSEFHTQTEVIQLARILEFDLYKVGYNVTKPGVFLIADTSHIKFKTNLYNITGSTDIVEYILGSAVLTSVNPRDYKMSRIENLTTTYISYSVTRFKLTYYNSRDSILTTPVTGSLCDSIRAIRVLLTIESPQPFDGTYSQAYYEKLMYPRNLQ
jgi:hypothetical protein